MERSIGRNRREKDIVSNFLTAVVLLLFREINFNSMTFFLHSLSFIVHCYTSFLFIPINGYLVP
jgi:hypothetical protein